MFNFFKKQFAAGIDISDYSIEVLQLSASKKVSAYGRVSFEEGIVRDGKIIKKEALAEKLKEAFKKAKPGSKKVVVSLPESQVFIRHFELPAELQGEKLKQRVFDEASSIIPWDPKQVYWDFVAVPEKVAEGSGKRDSSSVVYVGAPKGIVDQYIEVMGLAELQPIVVDIESLALGRALLLPKSQNTESVMILDMGGRITVLSIFDNYGVLNLSITIPVAGEHFTRTIAKELSVSENEAEDLKRQYGFDSTRRDNNILPVLETSFRGIMKEMTDAIKYYEQRSGQRISQIILTGGSSLIPGASEYLGSNLNMLVYVGNPFRNINTTHLRRGGDAQTKQKEEKPAGSTPPVDPAAKVKAIDYARKEYIKYRHGREFIRDSLIEAGWDNAVVEEALSQVFGPEFKRLEENVFYTTVVGLALRGLEGGSVQRTVNLLP